jgi:hypothetical protein
MEGEVGMTGDPDLQPASSAVRTAFVAAVATAACTVMSFGLALRAIPISGAFCPTGCVDYPYLNTASQFPTDFVWMVPAMLLVASYLVLATAIHACTAQDRAVFSQAGWALAIVATVVLLIDYYVQFSVVPVSLMNGETHGIPLIIQYNPHGVFLVLEELGYLVMSLSFLFFGLALPTTDRLERTVRRIFVAGFALAAASLILISMGFGLERLDRFEVAVITIDWLVLLANGVLLAIVFRRRLRHLK